MIYEFLSNFTEFGSVTSLVTFAVTILGALSLLLVNLGRYFKAKKYGIPLHNVHQANIAESAELWIALAGTLGFGVLVPVIMLRAHWDWWLIMPLIFAAFFMGFVMTKSDHRSYQSKTITRDGKEYEVQFENTLIHYALRSLGAAFAYMNFHRLHYNAFQAGDAAAGGVLAILRSSLAAIVLLYYLYHLLDQLRATLKGRLFGNTVIMVTEIDGHNYFVAMPHNQSAWFLMRYELETKSKASGLRIGKWPIINYVTITTIAKFTKDSFIIRDLSELPEPLNRIVVSSIVDKNKRGMFTVETEVTHSADEGEIS